MAYNIIFYEKENGKSEIWDFLENLRKKSATNKDARIQYKQAILYINLLQNNGTTLPDTITKHIDENNFILLHHFRKKTQKTPRHEIAKAKAERDDYLSQKEKNDYEKLE